MNDELLKAIRQILREELDKQVRPIIREELDKEREVTRADMRELRNDLRQEMHEGFARLDDRIDKFKLEMRFRLKHIAEVLTDHDKRLSAHEERLADHDARLKNRDDEPEDDGGNGNGLEE
jgi:hypothetical protein